MLGVQNFHPLIRKEKFCVSQLGMYINLLAIVLPLYIPAMFEYFVAKIIPAAPTLLPSSLSGSQHQLLQLLNKTTF